MGMDTINSWLEAAAGKWGHRLAISFLRAGKIETQLTYAQLYHEIRQFALFLTSLSVQKGDRVILLIEKSLSAVVAHFAILQLGAIAVPLNPGFKQTELEYLLHDADAALVITESERKALIETIDSTLPVVTVSTQQPYRKVDRFRGAAVPGLQIDVTPEDPALIIYTSGTTGNPKGAVLTHKNLVNDARNIIAIWEMTQKDILCHALPLFHVHGLCFALHTPLFSGAHVRLLDQFMPEIVLNELSGKTDGEACTVLMAVPTMYTKLMNFSRERPVNFSSLRLLTSGSAPLPAAAFERIHKMFGIRPVEREGMSETGMNFSNPLRAEQKPGSIGLALPGVAVRIVDPVTFKDVNIGEIGELWLKSPSITPGYWRKPDETAASFVDGWFRTGDLGKMDKEGYYYLTDRMKHIIITGGENVSAKEVETVINRMEGVIESSVVGVPDDRWGEKVAAAVVVKPEYHLTKIQIQAFCKERLHDWKCPKEILFINEIPKNTMGKMLKTVVKAYFMNS